MCVQLLLLSWPRVCMCSEQLSPTLGCSVQLTSELEALQQQLFQQKQQVVSLTTQNNSMQSELESSRSRLQGEAERAAFHQQQLDAEHKLRVQHSEQVSSTHSAQCALHGLAHECGIRNM